MNQLGLDYSVFSRQRTKCRQAQFLAETDQRLPQTRLIALIEPYYPKRWQARLRDELDQEEQPVITGMKAHIVVDASNGLEL